MAPLLSVKYYPGGTGRDVYIGHIENEPRKDSTTEKSINQFSRDFKIYSSPRKTEKMADISKTPFIVNYNYDGKGRDGFIGRNNGGFDKNTSEDVPNFFKRLRIREYDTIKKKKYDSVEFENRMLTGKINFPGEKSLKINMPESVQRLHAPYDQRGLIDTINSETLNPRTSNAFNLYEDVKMSPKQRVFMKLEKKRSADVGCNKRSFSINADNNSYSKDKINLKSRKSTIFNDENQEVKIISKSKLRSNSRLLKDYTTEFIKEEYGRKQEAHLKKLFDYRNRSENMRFWSKSVPKNRVVLEKIDNA